MDIKEYLYKAKEVETSLYEQRRMMTKLTNMYNNIPNSRKREVILTEQSPSERGSSIIPILCVIGAIIGVFVGFPKGVHAYHGGGLFAPLGILLSGIKYSIIYILIFGIIGLIISGIIIFIINCIDKAKINKENYYIRSENEKKYKFNNDQTAIEKQQQAIIVEEINILKQNYQQTLGILNKLYSLNIIFPKYQGLVPICSFYEYFCSGRCNTLEGHEGAYNIYESELRQNLIIDKLDIVIDKLEQIESAQYMLYDAVRSTNNNINRIAREMSSMSSKLQSISHNTQIIEYNTTQTRRNTDILTWLEVYKNT